MSTRHSIEIPCQPANPVDYLACCGLADLIARVDSSALTHWRTAAPVAFLIESKLSEAELLAMLLETFCDPNRWQFIPDSLESETQQVISQFTPIKSPPFKVTLDWWYETLTLAGDIADKSAWKMYAGQQTVKKITGDMVAAAASITHPLLVREMIAAHTDMTGRFGFDPRSTRDALNVGYSPNDLGTPVATYPFAELLVTFGVGSFFPSRTARSSELSSTRGWRRRDEGRAGFAYHLWTKALPVFLARIVASPYGATGAPAFVACRMMRKNYSNFLLAQPTKSKHHE